MDMLTKVEFNNTLKTNYNAIPLANENNNGLMDSNIVSRAVYAQTKYIKVATIARGAFTAVVSVYKDHMDTCDILFCFGNIRSELSDNILKVKRIWGNNPLTKCLHMINRSNYIDIFVETDLYCCASLMLLSQRRFELYKNNMIAQAIEELPEGAIQIEIE